jgi:hypothetical protein
MPNDVGVLHVESITGELTPRDLDIGVPSGFGDRCVRSRVTRPPGVTLARYPRSRVVDAPTRLTVQVAETTHIHLSPKWLELINHSCEPNCFFDVDRRELVSLRTLEPGDALTFFYPSTEWSMASPFQCMCGTRSCLGMIRGASELPMEVLRSHVLSRFIRRSSGLPAV